MPFIKWYKMVPIKDAYIKLYYKSDILNMKDITDLSYKVQNNLMKSWLSVEVLKS